MNSTNTSDDERQRLFRLQEIALDSLPHFGFDWNTSGNVFLRRQSLSRILFLDSIYRKIIETPGSILEFGSQFDASLSIYLGLRGIYEPYNFTREIYGFDTFDGFPSVSSQDGSRVSKGDLSVPERWQETLQEILELHKLDSPLPGLVHAETLKGRVEDTWEPFVKDHPHLSIALAYFDLDLYSPTKFLLQEVIDLMPKGAIVVLDEYATRLFPGETKALQEVLSLKEIKLQRSPLSPTAAWFTI